MKYLNPTHISEVKAAVREAGRLLFEHEAARHFERKGPTDFVTAVDKAVQGMLRERLGAVLPQAAFWGEEEPGSFCAQGPLWILDPVDGTTNLIHGFRQSAISLAYLEDGLTCLGIIYNPYYQEFYFAERGHGAWLNDRPIRVSEKKLLAESLIAVGTNPGQRGLADQTFAWIRRVYDRCHDVRRMGAASLDLCRVAEGLVEGFSESSLMPWDIAAGSLLVEEAGGRVSTQEGGPICLTGRASLIASNGYIHEELKRVIAEAHSQGSTPAK